MGLVLAVVAGLDAKVTGSPSPFPLSGGVNLYIGNHPEPCRTVGLRPGREWQELNLEATSRRDARANNAYFTGELRRVITEHPLGVARTMARKGLQLLNSRELPRNVDAYVFREWSEILSALVWKVGRFGFPFGLLLPLAVLGLVGRWREVPPPVRWFVLLVPLSIVAVFVSARYRVILAPVLAMLAAAGVTGLWTAWRAGVARQWMPAAAASIVVLVISVAPAPFCEEQKNYHAEMNYAVGYRHHRAGELNQAVAFYSEAVRENPEDTEVLNQLAVAYRQMGQPLAAVEQWRRAVQADPSFVEARVNLGAALVRLGRLDEGIAQYREALRVEPDLADAHHNLGVALMLQQRYDEAVAEFALAMREAHRYVRIYTDLAGQLEREGKPEVAAALRREVARVVAGGS
jgi:Tfp pilus assembly protein PilF